MRLCNVHNCDSKHEARGYCQKHYCRIKRNGSLDTQFVVGDDEKRFWSYVDKSDTCWIWQGAVSKSGYGVIDINGKSLSVHRYSFELKNGYTPDKSMHIDHLCRNRLCVNTSHMEVVIPRENTIRGLVHINKTDQLPVGVFRRDNKSGVSYQVIKWFSGKGICLGTYKTIGEADTVYKTSIMEAV